MRFVASLTRIFIGVFGSGEISPEPMEFAQAVEGLSGGAVVSDLFEPCAGLQRLLGCFWPGTVELHDLGPMHQAITAERHHVGLLVAPVGERSGPILSSSQGVDLMAAFDDAAVDQTRHNRRQFAADHGDHGLVHHREAFFDPPNRTREWPCS